MLFAKNKSKSPQTNHPYSVPLIMGILFYCYATFAALVFQKLLLPMFPHFYGGSGLINADSVVFHQAAVSLAESIKLHGWGQWSLWPAANSTGNVALLSVLYVFFGNDPTVIIPINAAVHAASGLLLYVISRVLWPGKVGTYSGIITATLFVVFPSSLNWYAQIHKDGFVILGMLTIFFSWIKGFDVHSRVKSGLWIFVGTLTGLSLVIFGRPYNIKLLILVCCIIIIILFFYLLISKTFKQKNYILIYFFLLTITCSIVNAYLPKNAIIENVDELIQTEDWKWKNSKWIPDTIEINIQKAAQLRVHNILYGKRVNARTIIDENVKPDNVLSVLAYMPRALGNALLAPFPQKWFESLSIVRIVSVMETMIWYLLIPGVLLTFYYRSTISMYLLFTSAALFLSIFGFAFPNVGTLYRIRYGYLFVLILMGIMGWMNLLLRRFDISKLKRVINGNPAEEITEVLSDDQSTAQTRMNIANAGFTVIIFTFVANVFLFLRDIILARWFGLGNELDAFFIAMIIPMFLVTVLCIPIGTVTIPNLLSTIKNESKQTAQMLISNISKMIFVSMIVICGLLYVFMNYYMPIIGWGFTPEKIEQSKYIMMMVLPILFFSGFVILGNSVLNALGKFAIPAIAQASVPIVAILILLFMASHIGVYAMAIGMFLGQIVNLFIVMVRMKKEGFSLFQKKGSPGWSALSDTRKTQLKSMFAQYVPLILSAFFVTLAVPVNNMVAATLVTGSVATFNLGNKFTLFFTGIIGAGISTVMLPYFSAYVAKNRVIGVRRELSFFLFLNTVVSIPLALLLFFISGPVIQIVFHSKVFTAEDLKAVTRVAEYGIIQLPFFAINILFSRFVTAKQKNGLIMLSSLVGLIINILLDFLFIKHMGVAGIALASTLSILVATVLFIIVSHRLNDILWIDVIMITLTWLLFLTIILCYHYHSMSGVIITAVSLIFIVIGHLRALFQNQGNTSLS